MNLIARLSLLLCLSLLLPGFLSAQTHITGFVRDAETNRPIYGAGVALPAVKLGGYTDDNGAFSLIPPPEMKAGDTLVVSSIGYETARIVLDGNRQNVLVTLKPIPVTTDDVVITAARGLEQKAEDLTVSVQVVKQRAVDVQATADLTRAITQMPGIDVLDGQINVRGSSGYAYGTGSRVMVMLNGLPLLSGDAASAPLTFLPTDNIQRIEVVKGASSVLYGSSAMGGVINVITGEPDEKWRGSMRMKGTLYGPPANRALDWDGKKMAQSGSVHAFTARAFRVGESRLLASGHADYAVNTGYRQLNGSKNLRLFGSLGWKYKGLTAAVNVSHQRDSSTAFLYWNTYYSGFKYSLMGDSVYSQGALTPAQGSGTTRRQLVQRTAIDPSVRYLSAKGDLFWYRGRITLSQNSNNTGQASTQSLIYNDFIYQRTLWKKLSLAAGLTQTYATVQADSLYQGKHSSQQLAAYTQLDLKLGRVSLNAGGRLEHVRQDTLAPIVAPVFRGGTNVALWKGANVRASFGQAYRVPSVAERFTTTTGGQVLVVPNPGLKPESGYSAELGLRQGFRVATKSGLKVQGYADMALFYQTYKNMLEFGITNEIKIEDIILNKPLPFSSSNVVNASILGSEMIVEAEVAYRKWHGGLSAGVTYLNPRNLSPVPDSQLLYLYDFDQKIDSARMGNGFKFLELITRLTDTSLKDAPAVLKYRSRWMGRISANVGYQRFTLTGNLRMQTQMLAIDQFLYMVVRDWYSFEQSHKGYTVLDLVLQYQATDRLGVSFHLDNATNAEYATIPGFLAEQRRGTVQVVWRW